MEKSTPKFTTSPVSVCACWPTHCWAPSITSLELDVKHPFFSEIGGPTCNLSVGSTHFEVINMDREAGILDGLYTTDHGHHVSLAFESRNTASSDYPLVRVGVEQGRADAIHHDHSWPSVAGDSGAQGAQREATELALFPEG
eukprot:7143414-Pyramimonas_sp.AAC.1